ncbi:MAG TPA: hypothetical protein VGG33_05025 [Polyangia bacterium]
MSSWSLGLVVGGFLGVAAVSTSSAHAADKASETSSAAMPATNACGCYEDSAGVCHCAKKNKCGCPGECEPAGCEQKRQKQLEKETSEELKRQQSEDKKRNAELEKKREELDRKDEQKREKGLRGLRLIEQEK